jgi:hypothetical protein
VRHILSGIREHFNKKKGEYLCECLHGLFSPYHFDALPLAVIAKEFQQNVIPAKAKAKSGDQ